MSAMGPGTNGYKALTLNGAMNGFGGESPFNTRAVHATEMPAANGITTARSLAKMYAATVGEVDGVRLFDDATVKAATAEQVNGPDACLVADSRFGCGYMFAKDIDVERLARHIFNTRIARLERWAVDSIDWEQYRDSSRLGLEITLAAVLAEPHASLAMQRSGLLT